MSQVEVVVETHPLKFVQPSGRVGRLFHVETNGLIVRIDIVKGFESINERIKPDSVSGALKGRQNLEYSSGVDRAYHYVDERPFKPRYLHGLSLARGKVNDTETVGMLPAEQHELLCRVAKFIVRNPLRASERLIYGSLIEGLFGHGLG